MDQKHGFDFQKIGVGFWLVEERKIGVRR